MLRMSGLVSPLPHMSL